MGIPKGSKQVNLVLTEEMIAEVERVAIKRKMSKAQVYRMCLGVGLECHKDLEKVGIVPMMDFMHFMKAKMKDIKADSKQLKLI